MGSASHEFAFFRGFLANPFAVGAPVPSGRALAAAIAAQIPSGARGPVVELGAGTGAVTEAILARGVAPDRLVAVEADPEFAAMLRARFARTPTLEGNAFAFGALLDRAGVTAPLDAIVSGLPVIGRPVQERAALLTDAMARLRRRAPFVQFTYAAWSPFPALPGVTVRRATTFWRNFPPMHIWVYALKG